MQLPVTIVRDGLQLGRHTIISFNRTLRVPEDGMRYDLPAGFGRLPILRVEEVAGRIPQKWRDEGGVIIPLYQREALFLEFSGAIWRPTISKVSVGGINAITGKAYDMEIKRGRQDYVVIPIQRWLDGINAGNDTVKQFVAMPLGFGYTVEAQVTDEEQNGGFQLVVFDPKDGCFAEPAQTRRWKPSSVCSPVISHSPPANGDYSLSKYQLEEAEKKEGKIVEMGIAVGGSIRQQIFEDKYGADTWDSSSSVALNIHIVNSSVYEEISGMRPPDCPITPSLYIKHNIPWLSHYEETLKTVSAPGIFKHLQTVEAIDEVRGKKPLMATPEILSVGRVGAVRTLTLDERVDQLRSVAVLAFKEGRHVDSLCAARECGELIQNNYSKLVEVDLGEVDFGEVTHKEYILNSDEAPNMYNLASKAAYILNNISLAEDLADKSLLARFTVDGLLCRLEARIKSNSWNDAWSDLSELQRYQISDEVQNRIKELSLAFPAEFLEQMNRQRLENGIRIQQMIDDLENGTRIRRLIADEQERSRIAYLQSKKRSLLSRVFKIFRR